MDYQSLCDTHCHILSIPEDFNLISKGQDTLLAKDILNLEPIRSLEEASRDRLFYQVAAASYIDGFYDWEKRVDAVTEGLKVFLR